MSGILEVVVGLVMLVGLVGGTTQIIPGGLVILAALLVWTIMTGGAVAWAVFVVAVVAVAASAVVKYLVAGRHMTRAQVPGSTVVVGAVAGIVLFFAIPVVGLFVGFVGGIFLCELSRRRDAALAWSATKAALTATALTVLIELAGSLVAVGAWVVGLIVT